MSDGGRVVLALLCEDELHASVIRRALDLVLRRAAEEREADWLTVDDDLRTWRRLPDGSGGHRSWTSPEHVHHLQPVRMNRQPDESPDQHAVRRVLKALTVYDSAIDAVVLCRDTDRPGLDRAGADGLRQRFADMVPFALALPHPEVEAWAIAGLQPEDEDERRRHEQLRQHLGFDPVRGSHHLSSGRTGKGAKRVLRFLWESSWATPDLPPSVALPATCHDDLLARCLDDLGGLTERGAENGWADFIADLQAHLLGCFADHLGRGPRC